MATGGREVWAKPAPGPSPPAQGGGFSASLSMGCGMSRILGNPEAQDVAEEFRLSGYEVVVGGQQNGTRCTHSGLSDVILSLSFLNLN